MLLYPGTKCFIRTLTMYHIGEVVHSDSNRVILRNASWVAETGPLGIFLRDGRGFTSFHMGDVMLFTNTIVDATNWRHDLPTTDVTEGL